MNGDLLTLISDCKPCKDWLSKLIKKDRYTTVRETFPERILKNTINHNILDFGICAKFLVTKETFYDDIEFGRFIAAIEKYTGKADDIARKIVTQIDRKLTEETQNNEGRFDPMSGTSGNGNNGGGENKRNEPPSLGAKNDGWESDCTLYLRRLCFK